MSVLTCSPPPRRSRPAGLIQEIQEPEPVLRGSRAIRRRPERTPVPAGSSQGGIRPSDQPLAGGQAPLDRLPRRGGNAPRTLARGEASRPNPSALGSVRFSDRPPGSASSHLGQHCCLANLCASSSHWCNQRISVSAVLKHQRRATPCGSRRRGGLESGGGDGRSQPGPERPTAACDCCAPSKARRFL